MVRKMTEAQILTGLKNNDNRVCKYLFEAYYTPLFYLAQKIIQNREEAEDIVLQVFSKFWSIREKFVSSIGIKSFLFIATRNHCLNYAREYKRKVAATRRLAAHWLSRDRSANIERLIIESDFLNRIHLEIQNLPARCRQIFLLTYFEGLTSGEIAKIMNITVSTVTTQRMRAIKFLKNVLAADDYWLSGCFLMLWL